MSNQTAAEIAGRPPLGERMARNADGIIEHIARDYGVSTYDVVAAMPDEHRVLADGEAFAAIMDAMTRWGPVLFIVHTDDIVLECAGPLPPGAFGRGYFNLHGDSPIGGHIKAENCRQIAFVSRPFMGRASCSVQFFNDAGEAMFKIFVRRDESRELVAEQLERFNALKAQFVGSAKAPE